MHRHRVHCRLYCHVGTQPRQWSTARTVGHRHDQHAFVHHSHGHVVLTTLAGALERTIAALEPKGAGGFDFTPADRLANRSADRFNSLGDLNFRRVGETRMTDGGAQCVEHFVHIGTRALAATERRGAEQRVTALGFVPLAAVGRDLFDQMRGEHPTRHRDEEHDREPLRDLDDRQRAVVQDVPGDVADCDRGPDHERADGLEPDGTLQHGKHEDRPVRGVRVVLAEPEHHQHEGGVRDQLHRVEHDRGPSGAALSDERDEVDRRERRRDREEPRPRQEVARL
jgi:hypothetical protein